MRKIIIIFVLGILASCKKDPPVEQPDFLKGEKEILIGTWHWQKSIHSYGFCQNLSYTDTIYSENITDAYKVIFSPNGIVQYQKNNVIVDKFELFFSYFEIDNDSNFHFVADLNNDSSMVYSGFGVPSNARFSLFPYHDEEELCGYYANYFTKQ